MAIKYQSNKERLNSLKNLCQFHFDDNYEWWSWEHGEVVMSAIELPKKDKNGNNCYTDPFIGSAGGPKKALHQAAGDAIEWINSRYSET